jgi:hypothetical protein
VYCELGTVSLFSKDSCSSQLACRTVRLVEKLLMIAAVPLLLATVAAVEAAEPAGWFVDPITVKVMHDRRLPFASSAQKVDLAGQRGECERAQLWGWDDEKDLSDITVHFADLTLAAGEDAAGAAVLAKGQWSYKQQGFVNASTPTHYTCIEDILTDKGGPPPPPTPPTPPNCADTPWFACTTGCPAVKKNFSDPAACNGGKTPVPPPKPTGVPASCNQCDCNVHGTPCGGSGADGHPCLSGWYPDPLLDVPPSGIPSIPKGFTQPIYLEVCIPYGQAAGNYSGNLEVSEAASGSLFSVPVVLEVWAIDLPRTNDTKAFNTAFNFNSDMSKWYPAGTSQETMWADWMPFLAHHRVPGDSMCAPSPSPPPPPPPPPF